MRSLSSYDADSRTSGSIAYRSCLFSPPWTMRFATGCKTLFGTSKRSSRREKGPSFLRDLVALTHPLDDLVVRPGHVFGSNGAVTFVCRDGKPWPWHEVERYAEGFYSGWYGQPRTIVRPPLPPPQVSSSSSSPAGAACLLPSSSPSLATAPSPNSEPSASSWPVLYLAAHFFPSVWMEPSTFEDVTCYLWAPTFGARAKAHGLYGRFVFDGVEYAFDCAGQLICSLPVQSSGDIAPALKHINRLLFSVRFLCETDILQDQEGFIFPVSLAETLEHTAQRACHDGGEKLLLAGISKRTFWFRSDAPMAPLPVENPDLLEVHAADFLQLMVQAGAKWEKFKNRLPAIAENISEMLFSASFDASEERLVPAFLQSFMALECVVSNAWTD